MTCPYLTEVVMVFCKASPVKKLVPAGSVTPGSCCEGGYRGCPLFRDAVVQAGESLADMESEADPPAAHAGKKGAQP